MRCGVHKKLFLGPWKGFSIARCSDMPNNHQSNAGISAPMLAAKLLPETCRPIFGHLSGIIQNVWSKQFAAGKRAKGIGLRF